jgi:hypothetical protein
MNNLYRNELRLFMNPFLPAVKLLKKDRVGSRLKRSYDTPSTPLDRLALCPEADQNRSLPTNASGRKPTPSPWLTASTRNPKPSGAWLTSQAVRPSPFRPRLRPKLQNP